MQRQSGLSRDKFWREVLVRQRASGLSIQRFCVKEGLATATFFGWKRRLSGATGLGVSAVNFAAVRVVPEDAAGSGTIEILLPSDRRVRIAGKVDRQQLADVLAALAG